MIGVPMTMILISACVERLMLATNKLKRFLKSSQFNVKCVEYTHLMLVFAFVFLGFFIIPAAIFNAIETQWNFLDSIYYWLVFVLEN
jgi:potassium channel subfamily K protein 1